MTASDKRERAREQEKGERRGGERENESE